MIELTSRELATVILFGLFVVAFLAIPNLRTTAWPSLRSVVRAFLAWKIFLPLALYGLYAYLVVECARRLGLWDSGVLKDTLIIVLFTGLPMFFRANEISRGAVLLRQTVRETLGFSVLLVFYLNLVSLPLWGELILQPVVLVLALTTTVAGTTPEQEPVRKLLNFILGTISLGLLIHTSVVLISNPGSVGISAAGASLAVSIWLPIALLPFIYVFAFIMKCEVLLAMLPFMNDQRSPTLGVKVAAVLGLHFNTRLADQLRGTWRGQVARSETFNETRTVMKRFRASIRDCDTALSAYEQRLEELAGAEGVDAEGLMLDRREFAATKAALRTLYCRQMGWRRNHGKYQADPAKVLSAFLLDGLPAEHGIELDVQPDGKAWRAWRTTPAGLFFGVGGTKKIECRWEYTATNAPSEFPNAADTCWVNTTLAPSSEEWAHDEEPPTRP